MSEMKIASEESCVVEAYGERADAASRLQKPVAQ